MGNPLLVVVTSSKSIHRYSTDIAVRLQPHINPLSLPPKKKVIGVDTSNDMSVHDGAFVRRDLSSLDSFCYISFSALFHLAAVGKNHCWIGIAAVYNGSSTTTTTNTTTNTTNTTTTTNTTPPATTNTTNTTSGTIFLTSLRGPEVISPKPTTSFMFVGNPFGCGMKSVPVSNVHCLQKGRDSF